MKKMMMIAAMMVATLTASAQHEVGTLTLQPKVGMNVATMTKLDDSKARVGLAVGAEFEYQFADIVSLSAGALYSMEGAKSNLSINIPAFNISATAKETLKMDYINIPILVNVYFAKGLAVKAGIQPALNVNGKYKISANGQSESVNLKDWGVDVKSFELSIPVGLSYEYNNIVLDARYNFGMTKAIKNLDCKNYVFQLTLGYKFEL